MKRIATPRSQTGQALVLLAAAFIGLAAFAGLAIDAGILFAQIGHLRRAVDAASLAAAGQFREGRDAAELSAMALQVIELNGLSPSSAIALVCDRKNPGSDFDDESLCPGGKNPPDDPLPEPYRKFVRVQAQLPVNFAFLPIVGWNTVTIQANAISEAASVDIVLAIDTSESMAYDGADEFMRDPDNCNPIDECHPFHEVRENAKLLVDRTYFPYDRIGLVTFDREAKVKLPLENGTTKADVNTALDAIEVYKFPGCPGYVPPVPDPRGCTSTNIADGLRVAGSEFCKDGNGNGVCDPEEMREEAVWIVILLTDGAANAAIDDTASVEPDLWLCPLSGAEGQTWVQPFCRDDEFEVGPGEFGFDTEDAAEVMAQFVGCPSPDLPQPAGCPGAGGQGAVVFTIGLGDLVTANDTCDLDAYPDGCQPDAAEQLLRYIAAVGDDGDPGTDDCSGIGVGESCGNYYFAQEGFDLEEVFEAIASRIFTRITH